MNVLHIVGSLEKNAGGPSRSVPQSCEFLSKLGLNILLITTPGKDVVEVNTNSSFSVVYKNFKQLNRFCKELDKNKIDIIHLQHIWNPYIHIVAKAARKKGIPYIITPRGMLEPWIMKRNAWKKWLAMWLYQHKDLKFANVIHATCTFERDNIRKLGYKQDIPIIPNGIDLSTVPSPKENFGSQKIVFLSRIHPKKGIEILLDAWHNLNINNWTLEIAGQGDDLYKQQLEDKIKKQNIKNVMFVGPKYGLEKWHFIKSADIFILPTYSENFGIVIAEALVVGVPVITTKGTPWKELENEKCGWWIDLSLHSLQTTLMKAIKTPSEELKQMGISGVQLIKSKYDIKVVAKDICGIYSKIV